jgi:tellurite resistance protein
MKRQKILSDKDGDRSDDKLHQEEESKSHLSLEQSKAVKQAPAKNIINFSAQCVNCWNWRLISTKKKYEEIRERIREDPFFCERVSEM